MIDSPTLEQFRRLAQSSPWRWTSVEFECIPTHYDSAVHAWIRRPGSMRVETPDGTVAQVAMATRPFDGAMTRIGDGPLTPVEGRWPSAIVPQFDSDGLVSAILDSWSIDWDDPMYQSYQWVAMLNPVEFSRSPHDLANDAARVELSEVKVVDHHGRRTWEAIAHPTADYDPRCDCCPLLDGQFDSESDDWIAGPPQIVRIDEQTAICTYVGGSDLRAPDIDVRIIAVDETMGDALFRR